MIKINILIEGEKFSVRILIYLIFLVEGNFEPES